MITITLDNGTNEVTKPSQTKVVLFSHPKKFDFTKKNWLQIGRILPQSAVIYNLGNI